MIWVPWISVIIFILTWLPFIIIGFKKGWAYSLAFSIILWLTTLMFVIINLSIFNKWLWPWYEQLVLKNETKVDIGWNSFQSYYKPSIILLALLFEFIIIYPFTFIVMYFINRFLLKRLFGHHLKKTKHKNEQKIVVRRKIKVSRMLGVSILGVSSIFPSAAMASGASIIFVPYKKSHWFNKANDYVAKVYAVGFAKNSKSSQLITSFMSRADQRLLDSMRNITAFNFSETTGTIPDHAWLGEFARMFADYKELYDDDEATTAVFKTVLKSQSNSVDLLALDRSTMRDSVDANGNVIGYNNTNTEVFITNIWIQLRSMIDMSKYLSDAAKNVIYEIIMDSIVHPFDSIFYKNWQERNINYKEGQNEESSRESSLENNTARIASEKNTRKSIIEILKRMSGNSDSFDYDTSLAITFPIASISRQNPGTGELVPMISDENNLENNTNSLFQTYQSLFSTSENLKKDYEAKEDKESEYFEQYNNFKSNLEAVKKQIKDKNNLKGTKQSEISSATTRISNNKSEVQSNDAQIVNLKVERTNATETSEKERLTVEINSLETKNIELNESIKEDEALKQTLNDVITTIDADLTILNQNKTSIEKDLGDSWKNYQDYKKLSSDAEKIYLDAKAKSEAAESSYDDSLKELTNKTSQIDNFISDYSENINKLSNVNKIIQEIQVDLDILEKVNLSFKYDANMNEWNFTDDGSVYYQSQKNLFMEKKESQYLEIWNSKDEIYKANWRIFSSAIHQWLGRKYGS